MTQWRKSYEIVPEPIGPMFAFVEAPSPIRPTDSSPGSSKILIDTIHDGSLIPQPYWDALLERSQYDPTLVDLFEERYAEERDWGADLVAEHLTAELRLRGLPCFGHYRVTVARALMDFGRFPGITRAGGAEHLHRFAINYPFSDLLGHELKQTLLEKYYDQISQELEEVIRDKDLKIAIHTYDKYNKAGTERPLTSIVTRPIGYQTKSEMPLDFFDPMYPAYLSEFTADRKLTYRMSLVLEKAGIPVAHNYPYNLPDGSIEVRAQVWFFFQYLRKHFEKDHPDTMEESAYNEVWRMLLDTNLRSTESEFLRSYLHMFRKAPPHLAKRFREARAAYEDIKQYLGKHEGIVRTYRNSPSRHSTLGIEVRKDYVWEFADSACRHPMGPKPENAHRVAKLLAEALEIYYTEDKVHF